MKKIEQLQHELPKIATMKMMHGGNLIDRITDITLFVSERLLCRTCILIGLS